MVRPDFDDTIPEAPRLREPWPGMWDAEREHPKLAALIYVGTVLVSVLGFWWSKA
jgi:hypothetical protein